MSAKEKRRQELDLQTRNRKEEIKNAAIRCFKEKGIDKTKISDIAKAAGVGEATVYRYFETKVKLVTDCAADVWSTEVELLAEEAMLECQKGANGFSKLSGIFRLIGSLYEKRPYLLFLLEQFENYITKENVPGSQLAALESAIFRRARNP